jgi:hypothetical protein
MSDYKKKTKMIGLPGSRGNTRTSPLAQHLRGWAHLASEMNRSHYRVGKIFLLTIYTPHAMMVYDNGRSRLLAHLAEPAAGPQSHPPSITP